MGGGTSVIVLVFTIGSAGTLARVFMYFCKATTYCLTFWSSDRDWFRSVFDKCRLLFVLAMASAGLCKRLYSRSNSSTRTSFFAACIISETDCRAPPVPEAAIKAVRNPPFCKISTLLFQRRLLDGKRSQVVSVATQSHLLTRRERAFYNIFSTLADAVYKFFITF